MDWILLGSKPKSTRHWDSWTYHKWTLSSLSRYDHHHRIEAFRELTSLRDEDDASRPNLFTIYEAKEPSSSARDLTHWRQSWPTSIKMNILTWIFGKDIVRSYFWDIFALKKVTSLTRFNASSVPNQAEMYIPMKPEGCSYSMWEDRFFNICIKRKRLWGSIEFMASLTGPRCGGWYER